ncbi:MAG: DUF1415 domain-containing protein [Gammaproteobacteria bacterium]|nr:DUF1415 domain-containing protein [Gammaproteobacteria bacterium]
MNQNNPESADDIIKACCNWLDDIVIGENFCPFAKRERERGSIRFALAPQAALESALQFFADELLLLDDDPAIETSLLIYPQGFDDFDDYLELLEYAQEVLASIGFEGRYQLASFHPRYCFEGCAEDDAENYTNRSPWPILHLIREDSVSRAADNYPAIDEIPRRNIEHARKIGRHALRQRLQNCYPTSS